MGMRGVSPLAPATSPLPLSSRSVSGTRSYGNGGGFARARGSVAPSCQPLPLPRSQAGRPGYSVLRQRRGQRQGRRAQTRPRSSRPDAPRSASGRRRRGS
eukprot:3010802-Alexandrium_andersonii.AAC.1